MLYNKFTNTTTMISIIEKLTKEEEKSHGPNPKQIMFPQLRLFKLSRSNNQIIIIIEHRKDKDKDKFQGGINFFPFEFSAEEEPGEEVVFNDELR